MRASATSTERSLKRLKDIGLCAAVETALFLSGILTVFSPIPVIFAYRKDGVWAAVAATVLSTLLIFGFSILVEDPATAIVSLTSTGVVLLCLRFIAFFIGFGLQRQWSFSKLLVRPIAWLSAVVAAATASLLIASSGSIAGVMGTMEKIAAILKEQVAQLAKTLPADPNATSSSWLEQIQNMQTTDLARILMEQLPLFAFWAIAFVTWLVVHTGIYYHLVREWKRLGTKELSLKTQQDESNLPRALRPWIRLWRETFTWRLPDYFIFPWLAAGALSVLPPVDPAAKTGALMLFKVLGTFYCFQGLSLTRFSMEYWRIPSFLRLVLYFSFLMIPGSIGFFALMALGVLDFWGDFRNKILKGEAV